MTPTVFVYASPILIFSSHAMQIFGVRALWPLTSKSLDVVMLSPCFDLFDLLGESSDRDWETK